MEIKSTQNQPATETKLPTKQSQAIADKDVQNRAILQASLDVSISSGNDSLALLYSSVVSELNQVLEADMGPSAIQKAYDSGIDMSPAATAERIVGLSANFFSSYQDQHPEMDYDTQVRSFVELIAGGINQGFSEARDILDGLQVLEGDIASNIDTTYDLVQDKLTALIDTLLNPEVSEGDSDTAVPG